MRGAVNTRTGTGISFAPMSDIGYTEEIGQSMKLTNYLNLVPWLKMRGGLLSLPHTS
jgi:hypothetical protein